MSAADPRPLLGEPISLDLLNTRWIQGGELRDLLRDTAGLAVWLRTVGLDEDFPADEVALEHTRAAREALAGLVDGSGPGAAARVDAVLAHGRVRPTLTAEGPGEAAEFADATWGPGWTAARGHLELLRTAPDRIRRCAHESCVLHFLDTSRNGTRRWCSMAVCGNRAKASRHYARRHDH
ncbi:CGNR zinc finger domain-containing protein [Streptomyces sp. C10-9-1]|uniref:CGNR zinc finger domain-containing protein n=1 Tax=Streptomyces sp. C10-9-1 TaxID=1859285 RepID=UPI00211382C8|nr:CGNR zinc finger domain-containing protein [Streptomyces sp. C10-9-1]MCQ6552925.1 CGNR zinc finger domain-containing protein [Streptomyces sp. C10-9-1]